MIECIAYFVMGYNMITKEYKQLYRCKNEKEFKYLESTKEGIEIASGYYSPMHNLFILNEGFGI